MSFKVWIHIEDMDAVERDEHDSDVGLPEEAGEFDTLAEAEDFVQKLMECSTEEGE